jgi:hypothetical protein
LALSTTTLNVVDSPTSTLSDAGVRLTVVPPAASATPAEALDTTRRAATMRTASRGVNVLSVRFVFDRIMLLLCMASLRGR